MLSLFWGKPVYVSTASQAPPYYSVRRQGNQVFVDLKCIIHEDSTVHLNYDVDIVRSLAEDFDVSFVRSKDVFSGLVGISPKQLLREIPSHSAPVLCHPSVQIIINRLSSIFEVNAEQIGLVGSRAIGLSKEESAVSDWDIVVNLPLSQMPELERRVWRLKSQARHLQREKFGLHLPHKLVLEDRDMGQLEIDVFPKAIDPEHHPLAGAKNWLRRTAKHIERFRVSDVALASEGWPILYTDVNVPVIILCNGFKGVFRVGDVIVASCFEVSIEYGNHTLNAWAIDDPFRDIENARSYFKFRED